MQDFFHQQYHCIFWEFLQQKSCQHQIQQAFLQIRSKVWSAGRSWCLDDNRPRRKIPNQNDGSFRKDMSDRSSGSMLNLPYLPRCTCSICKQSPSIAFLYKYMIMYRYIVSVYRESVFPKNAKKYGEHKWLTIMISTLYCSVRMTHRPGFMWIGRENSCTMMIVDETMVCMIKFIVVIGCLSRFSQLT